MLWIITDATKIYLCSLLPFQVNYHNSFYLWSTVLSFEETLQNTAVRIILLAKINDRLALFSFSPVIKYATLVADHVGKWKYVIVTLFLCIYIENVRVFLFKFMLRALDISRVSIQSRTNQLSYTCCEFLYSQ